MLLALCLLCISQAHELVDDALVVAVKYTLEDCTAILKAVHDFVDEIEDFRARRQAEIDAGELVATGLSKQVVKKMASCNTIIETVENFGKLLVPPPPDYGKMVLETSETDYINSLLKPLSKKIGKILFVATRDGDDAEQFHNICDEQGPTVVIIETTTGNVFGGYTEASWGVQGDYGASSEAFLFRLRPSAKTYKIKSLYAKYAIYRRQSYGPTFGQSDHEIKISDGALNNKESATYGGKSYTFPGHHHGPERGHIHGWNYELNNGVSKFQVLEYVVAKVSAL